MFFLLFKFSSVLFIKQRDGTFGKFILSSTPTCDHNFESRNLLSSFGRTKGLGEGKLCDWCRNIWGDRYAWGVAVYTG